MAFSFSCFSAIPSNFHLASTILITQYITLNITITYKDCSFSCNTVLLITCSVRYVCTQTWARSLQAYTALCHLEQGMAGQHIQDRTPELLHCVHTGTEIRGHCSCSIKKYVQRKGWTGIPHSGGLPIFYYISTKASQCRQNSPGMQYLLHASPSLSVLPEKLLPAFCCLILRRNFSHL